MQEILVWISLIAASVTALGVLIKKILVPGYRGVGALEDALPVFKKFTTTFQDNTDVFTVIRDIGKQFKSDSGSTLRDSINRLEEMAETNRNNIEKAAALALLVAEETKRSQEMLMVRFEAQRLLDEQQAAQQERILLRSDRLLVRVDAMIQDRLKVASELAARERQIDAASTGVAEDLAASRQRADDVPHTEIPGKAADVASQSPPVEDKK